MQDCGVSIWLLVDRVDDAMTNWHTESLAGLWDAPILHIRVMYLKQHFKAKKDPGRLAGVWGIAYREGLSADDYRGTHVMAAKMIRS